MTKAVAFLLSFFTFSSFAGPRVVGNGGDVLIAPVHQSDLMEAIKDAKTPLKFWIYHQEEMLLQGHEENQLYIAPPLGIEKLFSKNILSKSIYDLMDSVTIAVFMSAYCRDSQYISKDGSTIHYYLPPRICLSGYSLIRKLDPYNLNVQVEGLILHELSHFMGTNEAEAVSLQKRYIEDMKGFSSWALRYDTAKKLDLIQQLEKQEDPDKRNLLLSQLHGASELSPLQLFSPTDTRKIRLAIEKNRLDQSLMPILKSHLKTDLQKFSQILSR